MGSDLRRTVILDFYGVPGSGKTTESHEIAKSYRKLGNTVIEPSYQLDHGKSIIVRRIKKIQQLLSLQKAEKNAIRIIVRNNGYSPGKGEVSQTINIATKLYAVKKYYGSFDYIIFDEGFAQAAVSLSVNSQVPADENLNQILALTDPIPKLQLVYVKLSISEALKRIANRNSRDTRVEAMQTEQAKIALMKQYEKAANQISEAYFLSMYHISNNEAFSAKKALSQELCVDYETQWNDK